MNIPIRGITIKREFPLSAILLIIRNSATNPLVKGKPILAKAAKIKIFEIQGELSESELSSFIDLVFLRLNIRPTEKNSKQIINPWDTV